MFLTYTYLYSKIVTELSNGRSNPLIIIKYAERFPYIISSQNLSLLIYQIVTSPVLRRAQVLCSGNSGLHLSKNVGKQNTDWDLYITMYYSKCYCIYFNFFMDTSIFKNIFLERRYITGAVSRMLWSWVLTPAEWIT